MPCAAHVPRAAGAGDPRRRPGPAAIGEADAAPRWRDGGVEITRSGKSEELSGPPSGYPKIIMHCRGFNIFSPTKNAEV